MRLHAVMLYSSPAVYSSRTRVLILRTRTRTWTRTKWTRLHHWLRVSSLPVQDLDTEMNAAPYVAVVTVTAWLSLTSWGNLKTAVGKSATAAAALKSEILHTTRAVSNSVINVTESRLLVQTNCYNFSCPSLDRLQSAALDGRRRQIDAYFVPPSGIWYSSTIVGLTGVVSATAGKLIWKS